MSILDTARLSIGPLRYEFIAHDEWACKALNRLREHSVCTEFAGKADRIFHMANLNQNIRENSEINDNWLPGRYAAMIPSTAPRQDWSFTGDETGHFTILNIKTPHALFLYDDQFHLFNAPFQLPWAAILEDIVKLGGAVVHGGLVAYEGSGLIIIAPPGGGKTTIISRLLSPWEIYSDDAALVWPGHDKKILASPLPTWSVLLGRGPALSSIGKWRLHKSLEITGFLSLRKSTRDKASKLSMEKLLPVVFQAFCEHPRVSTNISRHKNAMIFLTKHILDHMPVWDFQVTKDGRCWELMATCVQQHLPEKYMNGKLNAANL